MFARLPKDKLVVYLGMLKALRSRDHCTLTEIHLMIGRVNWCASLIVAGRSFLKKLINLIQGLRNPKVLIFLTGEAKVDLDLWIDFLIITMGILSSSS